MVNILEFDMSIDYRFAWNIAARTCFVIIEYLDECMIIYKYKLSDPYLWTKFGCSTPDKIKFEKLVGKNIFLFHTEVYKDKPSDIKNLVNFCQSNKIDFWIAYPKQNIWRENEPHLITIRQILEEFEHEVFDLTSMNYNNEKEVDSVIKTRLKPIIRQINLNKLDL